MYIYGRIGCTYTVGSGQIIEINSRRAMATIKETTNENTLIMRTIIVFYSIRNLSKMQRSKLEPTGSKTHNENKEYLTY
jgi:hypothetical protein